MGSLHTSVHDASRVHVFKRAADLNEILPNGSLRNEALLTPKVLQFKKKHYGTFNLDHMQV